MYALGLHFEKNGVKAALLQKKKNRISVELLRTVDSGVKPLYTLASALSGKKVWITTGLEAWEVLIRQVVLKLTAHRALLKALPFQIESMIPFPLEEGILLPIFQKKETETEITLFAARRQLLEKHLEDLKLLEILPDQVSCHSSALHRFARFFFPEHSDLFLFNLGEEKSSYLFIQKGNLILAQTLSIGKRHFAEDFATASPQIEKELQRMTTFLSQKFLTRLFLLTGDLDETAESFIKNAIGSSFSFLSLSGDQGRSSAELQSHAIAIGLGLEEENGIQFRAGGYQAPQKLIKKKRALLSYFGACCALTLTVWITLRTALVQKEAALLQKLRAVHRESPGEGSREGFIQTLENWEKTLQKKPFSPSSYTVNVPNVSDVLAWLSSLPQLESIEIKRVHYFLTKFPKLGSENDLYEAKIDLEFTASSPRLAREFHDALLSGNDIVNAKMPIAWEASQENYATSFFLTRKELR
jgi:type IV pilus assembly protein PilM